MKLRDLFNDACAYVGGLAIALAGRAAVDGAEQRAANERPDPLRPTLAAALGFGDDIPPDADLMVALRKRIACISDLEQRWTACSARVRELGAANVKLTLEADDLLRKYEERIRFNVETRRQLAEREHQIAVAREKLRNGDAQGADHYLWTVTRPAIASEPVEGGGLQVAGALPGEEVGDVG